MKCPKCCSEDSADSSFCSKCGSPSLSPNRPCIPKRRHWRRPLAGWTGPDSELNNAGSVY